MFTGQIATIENEADWEGPGVIELVDEDSDTTTDLSAIANLVIEVTIRDWEGSVLATANVQVPGPGFQYQFAASSLSGIPPGTYRLVEKVTINGSPKILFDGTIAMEGNRNGY